MGIKVVELRQATPQALKDKNNYLIVAKDCARIVGTGTLIIMETVVGVHGRIENIVVDKEYRGKKIGERISKELIALAKRRKLRWVEISSRPSRVVANKLYRKLGFRTKHTNVYNLPLQ